MDANRKIIFLFDNFKLKVPRAFNIPARKKKVIFYEIILAIRSIKVDFNFDLWGDKVKSVLSL